MRGTEVASVESINAIIQGQLNCGAIIKLIIKNYSLLCDLGVLQLPPDEMLHTARWTRGCWMEQELIMVTSLSETKFCR